MPTLRKSETQHRIYAGNNGKQFLLDSINFLFAIKGKEFQKLNPSFTPPDATEFISFSHIVNRNIVGNRNKELHKGLEQFLKFICGDVVQGPQLSRCIYIVTLALGSFSITEYILMGRDEINKLYLTAFEWYTSQVLSCIQTSRDTIVGTIGRFMETTYFSQLPTIIKNFASTDEVSAVVIGSYVIHELHSSMDQRMYEYTVQMPFAAVLYKKGFKHSCREFISASVLHSLLVDL
jgi:hypothetical protein